MPLAVIPNNLLLPLEALKLARFVTSIENPLEENHDPPFAAPPTPIESEFGYAEHDQQNSTTEFGSAITDLFSAAFSKRAGSQVRVEPRCFKAYALDNSDAWFDEALGHEETQRWIERSAMRGRKIYMIVGTCTLTDTQFVQTSFREQGLQGQATAPVGLALAAAGAVVPLASLVDPSVQAKFARFASNGTRIFAPGELICTVKYREVGYGWLSSRALKNIRLSKTRQWSCMANRGRVYESDDEDEEYVIEVDMKDVGHMGDEWTAAKSEEGSIYVRS